MARFKSYRPRGVIPATLLAFNEDFSIDEAQSRKHLADVAATPGLNAITVNGHASEVHACSFEEQQRILEFSLDEVGDKLPLINGVYADGSLEAARIARMAEAAGAIRDNRLADKLRYSQNLVNRGASPDVRPGLGRALIDTMARSIGLPVLRSLPGRCAPKSAKTWPPVATTPTPTFRTLRRRMFLRWGALSMKASWTVFTEAPGSPRSGPTPTFSPEMAVLVRDLRRDRHPAARQRKHHGVIWVEVRDFRPEECSCVATVVESHVSRSASRTSRAMA